MLYLSNLYPSMNVLQHCSASWTPRYWQDVSMQSIGSKTLNTLQLKVQSNRSCFSLCLNGLHLRDISCTKIRYPQSQLIEVNAHSLFSKWFSESGKLVSTEFHVMQFSETFQFPFPYLPNYFLLVWDFQVALH